MDYLDPLSGLENEPLELHSSNKAPDGFGQFSKDKPEEEKTVEDYVAEFERYAALQDKVAARTAGVDPRGRTSRAQRALQNVFKASSVYSGSDEASRAAGAQNAQDDIFTLLDPTAWIADKAQVEDPGKTGGELDAFKSPNLIPGQVYTTSDGKQWRFKEKKRVNSGNNVYFTQNMFDYVGDGKLTREIADEYKDLGMVNNVKGGFGDDLYNTRKNAEAFLAGGWGTRR